MTYDISIQGKGFYMIEAASERGRSWMKQVDGFDGQIAYSDDTRLAQDIANGASNDGLRVSVNGKPYVSPYVYDNRGQCPDIEPLVG